MLAQGVATSLRDWLASSSPWQARQLEGREWGEGRSQVGVSTLAAVWAGLGWGVCVDQALSPCSPRRLKQPLEAAPPGSRSLWPPSSWVGSQQGPSPEPPTTYAQPAPAFAHGCLTSQPIPATSLPTPTHVLTCLTHTQM